MNEIIGYTGIITPNSLSGWVLDKLAIDVPVTLELYIDQELVSKSEATLYREDVFEKKIHPTGNCGFHFQLPFKVYNLDRIKILVSGSNIEIPWSGKVIQDESRKIKQCDNKYFFIHIPKTAGTSFRSMLYKQFDQSVIHPNFSCIQKNAGNYNDWSIFSELGEEKLNKICLITGHYPLEAKELFWQEGCLILTILREPISRICSLLAHLQRHDPSFKNKDFDYIFLNSIDNVSNGMTRLFSSYSHKRILDENDLQKAKENLARLDLVGLSEFFEETVRLAEFKFNWSLGNTVRTNVGHEYQDEFSESLLKEIQNANQLDVELYNYSKILFKKQLIATGISIENEMKE